MVRSVLENNISSEDPKLSEPSGMDVTGNIENIKEAHVVKVSEGRNSLYYWKFGENKTLAKGSRAENNEGKGGLIRGLIVSLITLFF